MRELILLLCLLLVDDHGGAPPAPTVPDLERIQRIDERLLSGSQPGPRTYAALHELGVRVVVSVDGRLPDVAALEAAGLRSVHLPIGYAGVPEERLRSLQRLAAEDPGSVFFHCHHGRHRGPAMAAIFWMLRTGGTPEEARSILERAGTSPDYAGLWRAVERFVPPSGPAGDAPLPAAMRPEGLVAVMDQLQTHRDDLDRVGPGHPDLSSAHLALLLEEGLRETARLDPDGRAGGDPAWNRDLRDALEAARRLRATDPEETAAWDRAVRRLDAACTACHRAHRG